MATMQEEQGPRYDIEVAVIGHDGNAFAILGAVQKALRNSVGKDGVFASFQEADRAAADYYAEATTEGDYDHLLRVSMQWVHLV